MEENRNQILAQFLNGLDDSIHKHAKTLSFLLEDEKIYDKVKGTKSTGKKMNQLLDLLTSKIIDLKQSKNNDTEEYNYNNFNY